MEGESRGHRIGRVDQTGEIEKTGFRSEVTAEPQTRTAVVGRQVGTVSFPERVGTAISGDAEKVVMPSAQRTFAPTGLDGGLSQDDDRVHSEPLCRLLGEGKILFDKI